MKAVLLVGGEGTRLRPLTYDVPKPLLPVAEIPYLARLVNYLSRFGIDEIVVTACYLSEQIKSFCRESHGNGVKLTYVVEESPLGTGGAVGNVADHLDGTFLVFNGDILTDFDLHSLLQFHHDRKASATLALTPVDDPSRYGVAVLTPEGRIAQFIEKPKKDEAPSRLINAGIYVVEPAVLSKIPKGKKLSIERELFPELAAAGHLFGSVQEKYWLDMGTPEDYLQAHVDFLNRKITLDSHAAWNGEIWLGRDVKIEKGTRVLPPVLIGDETTIESGSEIGPHAVIGKHCRIFRGATIRSSVLWDRVRVGKNAHISKSILGSGVAVGENETLENQILRSAGSGSSEHKHSV